MSDVNKEMGDFGEMICLDYITKVEEKLVALSPDEYDMMCDMYILNDDKTYTTVETKTCTVFENYKDEYGRYKAVVCIPAPFNGRYHNQIKKCREVDRLIFVAVPWPKVEDGKYTYYGSACIMEAPPIEERKFLKGNHLGKPFYFIPVNELKLLKPLSDKKTLKLMQKSTMEPRTFFGDHDRKYCLMFS